MSGVFKSKYASNEIEAFLDLLYEKKDIIEKLTANELGELLYDNKKILFESKESTDEPVTDTTE